MNEYLLGATADLSTTVVEDGDLTAASSVVLTVTLPNGTTETPAVTNPSLGTYETAYEPAAVGHYVYRFVSTTPDGIDEGEFDVVASSRAVVDYNDLKTWLGITDNDDDARLIIAANAANRAVTAYCGRSFEYVTTPAARVFRPDNTDRLYVDDFHTATGLIVKTDDAGTGAFGTTWAATDYELEPLNGRDGGTLVPYYRLRAVGDRCFPLNRRVSVQVTAAWGWASVPADVFDGALIKASRLYKRKDSPEGVLGGAGDYGLMRVSLREDPDVCALLRPFVRLDRRVMAG